MQRPFHRRLPGILTLTVFVASFHNAQGLWCRCTHPRRDFSLSVANLCVVSWRGIKICVKYLSCVQGLGNRGSISFVSKGSGCLKKFFSHFASRPVLKTEASFLKCTSCCFQNPWCRTHFFTAVCKLPCSTLDISLPSAGQCKLFLSCEHTSGHLSEGCSFLPSLIGTHRLREGLDGLWAHAFHRAVLLHSSCRLFSLPFSVCVSAADVWLCLAPALIYSEEKLNHRRYKMVVVMPEAWVGTWCNLYIVW